MIYFILGILLTITLIFLLIFTFIYLKLKNKKNIYNDFFDCYFKERDYEK